MAGNINRTITIGGDAGGAFEMMQSLRQVSSEMYQEVIAKAQEYSDKLNLQAQRAQNIIARERDIKAAMIEQQRQMAAMKRDQRLEAAGVDSEKQKKAMQDYRDELKMLNQDLREYGTILNEVNRQTSEHFKEQAQSVSRQPSGGRMGAGFSQGALAGGLTGFLTGGGLSGLMGTLVGGGLHALGTTEVLGFSAPDLSMIGGPLAATLFGEGAKLASSRSKLGATVRGQGVPGLAGLDLATTADLQRRAAQAGGGRTAANDIANTYRLERGTGLDPGALIQLSSMRAAGFNEKASDMFTQFLELAVSSDLWNVKSGDFSAMPREIANLTQLMSAQAQVMANPSAQQAMLLRMNFADLDKDKASGLFSGSRGQQLMMGIHQAIQSPSNQFQQAQIMEAIMRSNPNIGGGAVGLARARAIQARGLFGGGGDTFEAILGQIRESTDDPLMRQVQLVSRFQNLTQFFESDQLAKLVSDENKGVFSGKSQEEISKLLKEQYGFSEKNLKEMGIEGGESETERLNTMIINELQKNGTTISEAMSGGILKLIKFIQDDLPSIIKIGVDKAAGGSPITTTPPAAPKGKK